MEKSIITFLLLSFSGSLMATNEDTAKQPKPFNNIYFSTTIDGLNSPMLFRKTMYDDSLSTGFAKSSYQFGFTAKVGKKNKWTIGLDYSKTGYRTGRYYSPTGYYYYYDVKVSHLITQFNYHWKIKPYSSFYSGIGLGIRINNPTTYIQKGSGLTPEPMALLHVAPTFNYTLIGCQYWFKFTNYKLGIKYEVGFGTNGILRTGIVYKFK